MWLFPQMDSDQSRRLGSSSSDSMDDEAKLVARTNHNKIEKRRRDKMNSYINQLAANVPLCAGSRSKKLDKLTVLKLAVQHMKTLYGSIGLRQDTNDHPNIPGGISALEIKQLIYENLEGFLFTISCTDGQIIFVSGSVIVTLGKSSVELEGESIFQLIHPADCLVIKDQIIPSLPITDGPAKHLPTISEKNSPFFNQNHVVATDPLSNTSFHPGTRRAFFCRFKVFEQRDGHLHTPSSSSRSGRVSAAARFTYLNTYCTGYVKSVPTSSILFDSRPNHTHPVSIESAFIRGVQNEEDVFFHRASLVGLRQMYSVSVSNVTFERFKAQADNPNQSSTTNVLVAFARGIRQPESDDCESEQTKIKQPKEFGSRFTPDGKFLTVDEACVAMTGYLPQDLLGTSLYEFCHPEDIHSVSDAHRFILRNEERISTRPFRFRSRDGKWLCMKTKWRAFRNPYTKEMNFIIGRSRLATAADLDSSDSSFGIEDDLLREIGIESDPSTFTENHSVGLGRIGREIAFDILRRPQKTYMNIPETHGDFSSSSASSAERLPRATSDPATEAFIRNYL